MLASSLVVPDYNELAFLIPERIVPDALSCLRFGVYVEPLTIDWVNQLVLQN